MRILTADGRAYVLEDVEDFAKEVKLLGKRRSSDVFWKDGRKKRRPNPWRTTDSLSIDSILTRLKFPALFPSPLPLSPVLPGGPGGERGNSHVAATGSCTRTVNVSSRREGS